MKNKGLFRINFIVSIILLIGFTFTSVISYHANYQSSLDNVEQISALSAEGIYYQITNLLTRPVNTSLTMANDNLLISHLLDEPQQLDNPQYTDTIKDYLKRYKQKYEFDSVFLVSTKSNRYYNFNGLDRVLTKEDPENTWYYDLIESSSDYQLNVDNDEVVGADNQINVFVNCKIRDANNNLIGIVGVGLLIDSLKDMLREYEETYHVETSLISNDGTIQLSTTYTGYERKNWFQVYGHADVQEDILKWNQNTSNLELWSNDTASKEDMSYLVTRYIPELSWHLVVNQKTGLLIQEMKKQVYESYFIVILVIIIILIIITSVIRSFNRQITTLLEERQETFKKATEQLYDNIYELNITQNRPVGQRAIGYFESLGAKGLPYDQALYVIADKQIKEPFRKGYVTTFSPENIIREYESGNNHLRYDFMNTQDGTHYYWMRIDAHIFYSSEDNCIHMFTYRKNIDSEKRQELRAVTDEMTGFYTKKATERAIEKALVSNPGCEYALFIFDIDHFKEANDNFGHVFGDYCIRTFTSILREHFRDQDILGRIGGDEFVAFIPTKDMKMVLLKAAELSKALCTTCTDHSSSWGMSASIGIALFPQHGSDFNSLYKNADTALYQAKKNGRNGYAIYTPETPIY